MARGTLAKLSREKNLIPDLFALEHKPNGYTEDELTSVRVVNLQEYAHECAIREAMDSPSIRRSNGISLIGANEEVTRILKHKFAMMKEFVEVLNDREILIAVNAVTVNDATVSAALQLLFKMDEIEPGAFQQFGDWIPLKWS